MPDHTSALVRRYRPVALDGRPVALPPEPWAMEQAEPLRTDPPPAEPTQADVARERLGHIMAAIASASGPISATNIRRTTGLHREYIDQRLREMQRAGRVRSVKQGHLTLWVAT